MTPQRDPAPEVLEGIKVLELGNFITGPYASLLLADLGADVIKVERPEGDPFRAFRNGQYSPNFIGFNRNKRSVCLDLTSPGGKEAFLKLVDDADVLIENFRPGVMQKLGLDYEALKARRPALVYCAIEGFVPGSDRAGDPAFDTIGQALSGMLSVFVDPAQPEIRGPTLSDQLAGMYACYGVLGALIGRGRTGLGRRVDVNMVEATASFMPDFFASMTRDGTTMLPTTRAAYSHSFAVTAKDGGMIGIQLSSPEKFWRALLSAIEAPELGSDPRFARRADRIAHFDALCAEVADRFKSRSRDDWLVALRREDVPHAPVRTVAEVLADPAMARAGSFHQMEHPTMGAVTGISRPVRYDGVRPGSRYAPPTLGEHTADVLRDAGMTPSEILALDHPPA